MNNLNFSMRQVEGVVILDLSGRIALGETSSELHLNLRSLVDEGQRRVIINLEKVTGIDSSGLGTLVAGYATLEKNGGQLKLTNISPKVAELMTITKLYTVFEIFDDEQAAVASFGKLPEPTDQPLDMRTASGAGTDSSIL